MKRNALAKILAGLALSTGAIASEDDRNRQIGHEFPYDSRRENQRQEGRYGR